MKLWTVRVAEICGLSMGAGRPARFLAGGETVTARVEGPGETVSKVVKEVTR